MMSLRYKKSAQVTYLGREENERISLEERVDRGFKWVRVYIKLKTWFFYWDRLGIFWEGLLNLIRKFSIKKYLYTINHKRLGLNYFYFAEFGKMNQFI